MDKVNLRMVAEIAFSRWAYSIVTVNIGKNNLDTLDFCVCGDLLFYFIPEILVFI